MTSSLIQKLAGPPSRKRSRSMMAIWVESRSSAEQAAIMAAALSPEWGHVALLDALIEEGAPKMSDTAFRQWRKGLT